MGNLSNEQLLWTKRELLILGVSMTDYQADLLVKVCLELSQRRVYE